MKERFKFTINTLVEAWGLLEGGRSPRDARKVAKKRVDSLVAAGALEEMESGAAWCLSGAAHHRHQG